MKPPDCKKLFCGNLAYDIDDETMCKFFESCGELVGLRWLEHKDTGEFRVRGVRKDNRDDNNSLVISMSQGCAFIQFATSAEADKAILLNGTELMGR